MHLAEPGIGGPSLVWMVPAQQVPEGTWLFGNIWTRDVNQRPEECIVNASLIGTLIVACEYMVIGS